MNRSEMVADTRESPSRARVRSEDTPKNVSGVLHLW